jgi:hypothetical protein
MEGTDGDRTRANEKNCTSACELLQNDRGETKRKIRERCRCKSKRKNISRQRMAMKGNKMQEGGGCELDADGRRKQKHTCRMEEVGAAATMFLFISK